MTKKNNKENYMNDEVFGWIISGILILFIIINHFFD